MENGSIASTAMLPSVYIDDSVRPMTSDLESYTHDQGVGTSVTHSHRSSTSSTLLVLTQRETNVLHGIINGDRDQEIARAHELSLAAVKACGASLRAKLGARTRTEVAVRGLGLGYTRERRHSTDRRSGRDRRENEARNS
jgi:DNA-binding NarL/FixJ family response regulator